MILTSPPLAGPLFPTHTYYPYPITSRSSTHQAILQPLSPYAYGYKADYPAAVDHAATDPEKQEGPRSTSSATASAGTEERKRDRRSDQRKVVRRAEKRALAGKRPAGMDMGREADELSDEERTMEDERDNLNLFGHRFLLPYGRRQTQSELDAAPASPTPSQEGQNDRMQEDPMGAASPIPVAPTTDDMEVGEGDRSEDVVDLDASVEDMDADDIGSNGDSGDGPDLRAPRNDDQTASSGRYYAIL